MKLFNTIIIVVLFLVLLLAKANGSVEIPVNTIGLNENKDCCQPSEGDNNNGDCDDGGDSGAMNGYSRGSKGGRGGGDGDGDGGGSGGGQGYGGGYGNGGEGDYQMHRLQGYVEGTIAVPPRVISTDSRLQIQNPTFVTYEQQDSALASWLMSSVSPSLHTHLVGLRSAFEIWNKPDHTIKVIIMAVLGHVIEEGTLIIRDLNVNCVSSNYVKPSNGVNGFYCYPGPTTGFTMFSPQVGHPGFTELNTQGTFSGSGGLNVPAHMPSTRMPRAYAGAPHIAAYNCSIPFISNSNPPNSYAMSYNNGNLFASVAGSSGPGSTQAI
ncbi:hypothetical protein Goshw_015095 [Gossypium schwendimanii]|uniref:Uncharacterized protein n=1 Tax=Gossypium schwendimanii TaxID=34291 RepID=A0A7J9MJQ4_GOSSC|nr:hypothetical protein [Gossypium schwendimanii]